MRPRSLLRAACLALALASGGALLVTSTDARAQSLSVVFVDVDKVVNDCEEGKAAQNLLKAEQGRRQTEIGTREAQIKRLQDELEKQSKSLSAASIEKKAAQYQQAVLDYQNLVARYNKELEDKERDLFDPIEKRIRTMLRDIALRDGYDMILNKRSVPYGRKDLDLTDRVTQEYNHAYPVKSTGPAPKAPPKGGKAATPAKAPPK